MIQRLFLLSALIYAALPVGAQQSGTASAAQGQPSTTIRATTQEVVLDMTFRDKKGKPVRDIKPEEIEITDAGQTQSLKSFKLVEDAAAAEKGSANPPQSTATGVDPLKEIRLVSLVFEGLDVEGKRFFRAATKDLLSLAPEQNLYFSVFTIDQKLHCLQPFTTDHKALQSNVDRAATWSFIQYQQQSQTMKESLAKIVAQPPSVQSNAGDRSAPAGVGSFVNYQLAKIQYDMLEASDRADRETGARASLFSLMELVREQSRLPGRKVILYFNPWFTIPDQLDPLFKNLVSLANRSNVTFYTIDSKGLVTWSQGNMGRDQISGATGEIRRAQQAGGAMEVTTANARSFDSAREGIRANPQLALTALAEETGGFLTADTNDYRAPLRKALEEIRTYYEATYAPAIASYDGAFRKISVSVKRPDVTVHTRAGYFALPPATGGAASQVMAYELPLLNAMNAATLPSEFPFKTAAHRFNTHDQNIEYMITMEVPMSSIQFQPDEAKKTAAARASLLAVIKNEQGEIVQKFSKDFPVNVPLDKVKDYQASNIIQTWRATVPAGRYSLASLVSDGVANKVSAKKVTIVAPAASAKLAVSNVVFIRRVDQLKDTPIYDAFYFEGGKIVPSISDVLKGGPGNVLPFYFAVYPNASAAQAPELTMSFFKDGQALGAAKAPLPKPDKTGRIPYIANIPADAFQPGQYEMRATINQGGEAAEEKVFFTIE